MFQITAVTTTSLSFSWLQPAYPNGVVTGYQLSCQPLLLGIPTPEPLSPESTARMAVLADLLPGVRYNCSIGAMNCVGQSPLVYADDTTTEIGRCMDSSYETRPAFLTCSLEELCGGLGMGLF